MIDFHLTQPTDLKVLQKIQEQFDRYGGRMVLFQRLTAVVVITWDTTHLEWIPPYATSMMFRLRNTFWTAALGWWSFTGLCYSPAAILTNILGGVDVTELVSTHATPQSQVQTIAKAHAVLKKRLSRVLFIEAMLLILGFIVLVVLAARMIG